MSADDPQCGTTREFLLTVQNSGSDTLRGMVRRVGGCEPVAFNSWLGLISAITELMSSKATGSLDEIAGDGSAS